MRAITVVDYDPAWPRVFSDLCTRIRPVLEGVAASIEHVGSTAVPGLPAKPVIDMTVIVPSNKEVPRAIDRLATIGYVYKGDLGIEGREAFRQPPELPEHHLYLCPEGSTALANHLAVRDYLRRHPGAARAYGNLKKQLAQMHRHDIDRYAGGKTTFLIDILRRCGLTEDQLVAIQNVNRIG